MAGKKALFVGINKFEKYPQFTLNGCVNDAKMQYRWLKEEGWNVDDPEEVRYYTDDPSWTMGVPTATGM